MFIHNGQSITSNLLLLSMTAGVFLASHSNVYAGFEWVPGDSMTPMPGEPASAQHSDSSAHDAAPIEDTSTAPMDIPAVRSAPNGPKLKTISHIDNEKRPIIDQSSSAAKPPMRSLNVNTPNLTTESSAPAMPMQPQKLKISDEILSPSAPIPAAPISKVYAAPHPHLAPELQPKMASGFEVAPTQKIHPAYDIVMLPQTSQPLPNAVGFGEDMPLALVMRQIVPAKYTFSFARSVNPGSRVSWTGGQPWNYVLSDVLKKLGLVAKLENNNLIVFKYTEPYQTQSAKTEHHQEQLQPLPTPVHPPMQPVALATTASAGFEPNPTLTSMPPVTTPSPTLHYGSPLNAALNAPKIIPVPAPVVYGEMPAPSIQQKRAPQGQQEPMNLFSYGLEHSSAVTMPPTDTPIKLQNASSLRQAKAIQTMPNTASSSQAMQWEAQSGDSLKFVLESWSKQQGNTQLIWDLSHDYSLTSNVFVEGSFEQAVTMLIGRGLTTSETPSYRIMKTENNLNSHNSGLDQKILIIENKSGTVSG